MFAMYGQDQLYSNTNCSSSSMSWIYLSCTIFDSVLESFEKM